mgnify:CR=1 FL=1
MFTNVEHIGIAVKDLEQAKARYQGLLNTSPYKEETVAREGVRTSFFKVGATKIELLQATEPDSPIQKFIDKKGEGIHHMAFEVDDIEAEMQRLQAEGYQLLMDTPKKGADNKLICFVHPKSSGGVLIELCQEIRS